MSFSIKNKDKLPNKLPLYFNNSNWWLQKRSKENAFAVYHFLVEKYIEAILCNKKPTGYSPSRIAEATKIDKHQVTYALWIFAMLDIQPYRFETDITPGGKPRHKVFLMNLMKKERKKLDKLLEEQKNK